MASLGNVGRRGGGGGKGEVAQTSRNWIWVGKEALKLRGVVGAIPGKIEGVTKNNPRKTKGKEKKGKSTFLFTERGDGKGRKTLCDHQHQYDGRQKRGSATVQ